MDTLPVGFSEKDKGDLNEISLTLCVLKYNKVYEITTAQSLVRLNFFRILYS